MYCIDNVIRDVVLGRHWVLLKTGGASSECARGVSWASMLSAYQRHDRNEGWRVQCRLDGAMSGLLDTTVTRRGCALLSSRAALPASSMLVLMLIYYRGQHCRQVRYSMGFNASRCSIGWRVQCPGCDGWRVRCRLEGAMPRLLDTTVTHRGPLHSWYRGQRCRQV